MICAVLLAAALLQDAETITATETPDIVAQWVAADLATLPADQRAGAFYLWLPRSIGADATWHHAGAFAVNTAISRSGRPQRPIVIAGGWLQRWDLAHLVPDIETRAAVAKVLGEAVAADPNFRIDGQLAPAVVAPAAELMFAAGLADLPVMRIDYALEVLLSNIDAGRYLDLRFTGFDPTDPRTDEEKALAVLGVFRQLSIDKNGDDRVAVFASNVTDKPRIAMHLRGIVGEAWVTDDILDETDGIERDPIYNLITPVADGSEWIIELPNGLHAFLITDRSGQLLREAPGNLVSDHEVPRPKTRRLEGAISCIRCHGPDDGLKPCPNDVATLLSGGLSVLVDSGQVDSIAAADAVASRYAGRDFDRSLRIGRERYAATIDELTGGEMTPADLAKLVADIFARRKYARVTARDALADCGILVDPFGFEAQQLFAALAAPLESPTPGVAVVEDISIAALSRGLAVRSAHWDRVKQIVLARVLARRALE